MIWIGNVFFDASCDKELFYTERKQGGKLYHIFNIGIYEMNHVNKGCKAASVTIPFVNFKIGYNPAVNTQ